MLQGSYARRDFAVGIRDALNLVQIILAVVLIALVLLQTKGSGFSGMFGGDSSTVYRTRRGIERRMFQATIGLAVTFFVIALVNSLKF
jgi:preprotein translocase subunit SecG